MSADILTSSTLVMYEIQFVSSEWKIFIVVYAYFRMGMSWVAQLPATGSTVLPIWKNHLGFGEKTESYALYVISNGNHCRLTIINSSNFRISFGAFERKKPSMIYMLSSMEVGKVFQLLPTNLWNFVEHHCSMIKNTFCNLWVMIDININLWVSISKGNK